MPKQKRLQTTVYRLPAPITPLRLALLTDLHNLPPEDTLSILAHEKPDAVMVAGDLFESPPRSKKLRWEHGLRLLEGAASLAPTFYVQGNHDYTLTPAQAARLTAGGAHLLTDSFLPFRDVTVGGLPSGFYNPGRQPNLAFARRFAALPGYKILLCHHPEYYRFYLKPLPIDLILSGHNHGGQWQVFGRGVYVPKQGLFPPHTAGVFDGRLVVSRGLSNPVPVPRINNPTEVVILALGKDVTP
ncbi:MAG: metallophosphoesterase [Eubacteriales bacterium]